MNAKFKKSYILIATVFFLFSGYFYYQHRQYTIGEIAKRSFLEAVNDEANKRIHDTQLTVSMLGGEMLKEGEAPRYVVLWDQSGKRRKYKIDSEKHWKNVTMNSDDRTMHSYAFEERALDVDSLNLAWRSCLEKDGVECHTGIYMLLTDRDEKTTSLKSSDSEWCQQSQVFQDFTIGYRCEIECILYLQYSLWTIIGFKGICYMLLYFLLIFILYRGITIFLKRMDQGKILKKEVLMNELNFTTRVYSLGNNIIYYAERRELCLDEEKITLTNQPAELFEHFIQKNDHSLSNNEIARLLWNQDYVNENRIYQIINRLRNSLLPFPSIKVEKVSVGIYRLIISEI